MTLAICSLAEHPEYIDTLADWYFDAWHDYEGYSLAQITAHLKENCLHQRLPCTWIALKENRLAGTISLEINDLPPRDAQYSPWLASLYVASEFRGQGIGTALIQHLLHHVDQHQITPLYLWTPGTTALYESLGWRIFEQLQHAGKAITVMKR